jgi:dTDP-4-amino-4,6-dideoxygalactose transaminase
MLNTGFSPWPSFNQEEADAVAGVLLSNRVNYLTGTEGRAFEREFAAWNGVEYAIALNNGTAALEIALKALDIGPGDEVVVTPRTFLASASSIIAVGARPVFADVDRDSQNITADTIRPVLTERTRAIMCVHLAGWPCDMDPILDLATAHGLSVLEDCAQAHGAVYRGRLVGAIGDIGAWSFCQDKIITTGGEGGMVTTSSRALWSRMWSSKDHGKSYEAMYERSHAPGFRWVHESFGTNARMLEVQSAIGRLQLARLGAWSARRAEIAGRLADACEGHSAVRVPVVPDDVTHAWYRFYAFAEPMRLADGWSRDRIIEEMLANGVPCYSGSCPEVYLERAFDGTDLRPEVRLPVARELGETSLMFLVHPTLTDAEVDRMCAGMKRVLERASLVDVPAAV